MKLQGKVWNWNEFQLQTKSVESGVEMKLLWKIHEDTEKGMKFSKTKRKGVSG